MKDELIFGQTGFVQLMRGISDPTAAFHTLLTFTLESAVNTRISASHGIPTGNQHT